MQEIIKVLRFGAPFLRRYWFRFSAGVLLGLIFGLSNASIVGATTFLVDRLDPAHATRLKDFVAKNTVTDETPVVAKPPPKWVSHLPEVMQPAVGGTLVGIRDFFGGIFTPIRVGFARLAEAVDIYFPLAGRPLEWRQFIGGILLLPTLAFIRGFVGYLSSYCMAWASRMVMVDLKQEVFAKLNRLSMDFHSKSTTGDTLLRVNGDTGVLYGCLSLGLSDLIKEPFTLISVVAAMCLIDMKLTMIALIFIPMFVLPTVYLGRKIRRISKQGVQAGIMGSDLLVENAANIRVVKAFGVEDQQVAQFAKATRAESRFGMRMVQSKELLNPILETFSSAGVGLVIMYIFYSGQSIANLVAFLSALGIFYTPLKKLAGIHLTFQQGAYSIDRLVDIMKLRATVEDPQAPRTMPEFHDKIEFKNVVFGYIPDKKVLNDVTITVPKGSKLGLVGATGSGKSSLLNLLYRFWDVEGGAVLIDGIDVRDVLQSDLRKSMSLVSQDVLLFNTTIAENIALGKQGAVTQEEIEAAAKAANAHDFIMKTPYGYQTKIGEKGVTLSGGQKQRLSIARAFIRNAPILALDEATASLDTVTEKQIQDAIEILAENRTVITVAHRLSTLANCDQIVVLNKDSGLVAECGTFDELIRKNGLFADMARQQAISLPPLEEQPVAA